MNEHNSLLRSSLRLGSLELGAVELGGSQGESSFFKTSPFILEPRWCFGSYANATTCVWPVGKQFPGRAGERCPVGTSKGAKLGNEETDLMGRTPRDELMS